MKTYLAVSAASLFLALGAITARSATITWTNTSGGKWSVAANWSPNGAPGATDTAAITTDGGYSVSLDVNATVAGLILGASNTPGVTQSLFTGGQTLTVNGLIQVESSGNLDLNGGALTGASGLQGMLTWSGGSLSGVLTITTNSVLNIVTGGGDGFNGLVLTNYGTVNWTNATLYGINGNNAQIYNYGLWNAQSDNTFVGANNNGPRIVFSNFGTFLKSGNNGTTVLDGGVVFNNTGTVEVESGTLNLQGGGTSSGGDMITTNGGVLNFYKYAFTDSTTFAGSGSYVAGGATFAGPITGTLNWDGGSLSGVLTITTNSVLNIVTGGGDGFNGLVLSNYGTVNWSNTTLYGINGNNAHIYNYGLWNAQSDNAFIGANNNGPPTLFDNFGTFLKSGSTNVTLLDAGVVFSNMGLVEVESGTLNIGGGTSSGGQFSTAVGSLLNFISTAYNFINNTTFAGVGASAGAGATFNGQIAGMLSWDGGSLSGLLTLASNGVLNMVAGGGDGFNGLVLSNYGTVNWSNTTLYGINGNNAHIYNYGLWNAQSDNAFIGANNNGPPTLFDNFGTFIKSGNSGTTVLDGGVLFNNTGTVTAESGTLEIEGGGVNSGSGTFGAVNGGLLALDNITFADSTTIRSSNLVELGGDTTVNGVLTGTNLELVSGVLAGTNVLEGTLTWSGGSMAGVLTIASNSVLNIVAGGGDGFNGLVLTNYGTVNWTNITLYGINGGNALIYNYGLWNAESDNTFVGANNNGPRTVFSNFGTFLKSGNNGTTVLDGGVVFNNTGTVEVESGTLNLTGGGTSSGGDMITTNGGVLNFDNYAFTNSTTFAGSGSYVAGGAIFAGPITGTLNWDGGSLSGVLTITTNSVLNIVAKGGDGFNGLVLSNYGTVNWTNTPLYGINGNNAQIYNYGLWNAQTDNAFVGANNNGSPTLFDNFGTFLKSGSTNVTLLDAGVIFNNMGLVEAASGTLEIGRGTSSGGQFITAAGAFLSFVSTAYNFTNSTTFVGVGASAAAGATFNGSIAGMLSWDGGSLSGVLNLTSNGVLNIVTGGGDGFNGLDLTNYGTVNWTNTTLYGINGNNAQIYNYGLWNAQSDNAFIGANNNGPPTLFDNFGTFIKSGNSGTTVLDGGVVFNNTGLVNVENGTLEIEGGGVNSGSGTFATANGGLLELDNITFADSTTIRSGNVVEFGGHTTVNGVLTVTNLELVSGEMAGTNVLQGMLTWSGGSMAGFLTLASNSVLNIVAGGGDGFNGLVLTNYGTVNWTNITLYGINGGNALVYNYGLWNVESDNTFVGANNNGPVTVFNNFGTFLKSGNTGTTVLDGGVVFNNTGTVEVESGTLNLTGGGTSSGGDMITTNGGVLNFYKYAFTDSTTFAGSGSYVAGGATFAGPITGTLNWDGGSLSGVLTITTNSVLNIVTGGGDGFNGLVLSNYGTVNWTNTSLYGINGNNAQIYNYGLWNAQTDNAFVGANNNGSPTLFDNFGTFLKSGSTNVTLLDAGVVFNNMGLVEVESGTLNIGGGTSSGGQFSTAVGSLLNFISTAYNYINNTTFAGVGASAAAGATFNGSIAGMLSWDGGSLSGVLTLASNGVLNIVAGGGYGFNGLVLTNYGTVNWSSTTLYGINGNNAHIYNYGLWNAQTDNAFVGANNNGSPTLFDNFGTFLKSGSTNVTFLDAGVIFNNTGTVNVESGTMSLNNYNLTGGTLDFGINSLTNFGQINLSGNPAQLAGTLSATLDNGYVPQVDDAFQVLNFASSSGTFTGTDLPPAAVWQTTYNKGNVTIEVLSLVSGNEPPPTHLQTPQLSGGLFSVNFGTINGQSYTVQQSTNLAAPDWTFYTNFIGNGSLFQLVAPFANVPQMFFRVREP